MLFKKFAAVNVWYWMLEPRMPEVLYHLFRPNVPRSFGTVCSGMYERFTWSEANCKIVCVY